MCLALAAAAAAGLAAPVGADPSSFNVLSCSCPQPAPRGGPVVTDQINRGIETALTDLEGISVPQ
ncbi:hypothetical protein [Mycobacterium servetii]|uniref:Uncharacterized protein n=1 Tax=Mycobacterium servetii TaxID=3237418 RepID=A0ABV4C5L9_9MYCO